MDFYYSDAQAWYSAGVHPLVVAVIFLYIILVVMTLSVLAYVNKKRRIKVIREHGTRAKTVKVCVVVVVVVVVVIVVVVVVVVVVVIIVVVVVVVIIVYIS